MGSAIKAAPQPSSNTARIEMSFFNSLSCVSESGTTKQALIGGASGYRAPTVASMRPQVHQADAIRKEHDQHHANAEHHGRNQQQEQPQTLKAHVHEIRNDQRRFDERKADQNRNHQMHFQAQVGQENFHDREQQQPHPNRGEQFGGPYGVLVRELGGVSVCAHRFTCSLISSSLRIHAQQIHHRKNELPDQVHKVPVQAADFHVLGSVLPFPEAP